MRQINLEKFFRPPQLMPFVHVNFSQIGIMLSFSLILNLFISSCTKAKEVVKSAASSSASSTTPTADPTQTSVSTMEGKSFKIAFSMNVDAIEDGELELWGPILKDDGTLDTNAKDVYWRKQVTKGSNTVDIPEPLVGQSINFKLKTKLPIKQGRIKRVHLNKSMKLNADSLATQNYTLEVGLKALVSLSTQIVVIDPLTDLVSKIVDRHSVPQADNEFFLKTIEAIRADYESNEELQDSVDQFYYAPVVARGDASTKRLITDAVISLRYFDNTLINSFTDASGKLPDGSTISSSGEIVRSTITPDESNNSVAVGNASAEKKVDYVPPPVIKIPRQSFEMIAGQTLKFDLYGEDILKRPYKIYSDIIPNTATLTNNENGSVKFTYVTTKTMVNVDTYVKVVFKIVIVGNENTAYNQRIVLIKVRAFVEGMDLTVDSDKDTIQDIDDNCVSNANTDQADMDLDGWGDVCDYDIDGDGLKNDFEIDYKGPHTTTPLTSSLHHPEASNPATFAVTREARGTDRYNADTDGDGLIDGLESNSGRFNGPNDPGTHPLKPDTDGDTLTDGAEALRAKCVYGTYKNTCINPLAKDTDGDTIQDNNEITPSASTCIFGKTGTTCTDPTMGDTDQDLVWDNIETSADYCKYGAGANKCIDPTMADTDEDYIKDGAEIAFPGSGGACKFGPSKNKCTDPTIFDTDSDGLGDGVENGDEIFVSILKTGTDPFVADTEGDGVLDGTEIDQMSSPFAANTDNDGYPDNTDACPRIYNSGDTGYNTNIDGDPFCDFHDPCPLTFSNADQMKAPSGSNFGLKSCKMVVTLPDQTVIKVSPVLRIAAGDPFRIYYDNINITTDVVNTPNGFSLESLQALSFDAQMESNSFSFLPQMAAILNITQVYVQDSFGIMPHAVDSTVISSASADSYDFLTLRADGSIDYNEFSTDNEDAQLVFPTGYKNGSIRKLVKNPDGGLIFLHHNRSLSYWPKTVINETYFDQLKNNAAAALPEISFLMAPPIFGYNVFPNATEKNLELDYYTANGGLAFEIE